jgi:hypothetical protein
VQAGDAAEALDGVASLGERGAPFLDGLAHGAVEDRGEDLVLAAEVEVDRAGGDAGAFAMSATWAPKKPCFAKVAVAASRMAVRLSVAAAVCTE